MQNYNNRTNPVIYPHNKFHFKQRYKAEKDTFPRQKLPKNLLMYQKMLYFAC